MLNLRFIYCLSFFLFPFLIFAQDISLFQQHNGNYDFLTFGNTLNTGENTGGITPCEILTESSAEFQLSPGQEVIAAYLYWAGVGPGDTEVLLNETPINSERLFNVNLNADLIYFAAYADVTSILQNFGVGNYTLSDLNLTGLIQPYCANTTNFGGWAITVIYEDSSLPLNQVNIFDGLEIVSALNQSLTIELENLNVLDNTGAKIGFLAWEGDASLAVNETLQINGNVISNPPLNPEDNAFNSTNSFTGSDQLYNMDIDYYNIENNIIPGDQNATIMLTSGQDMVLINNIITVLNTELPDATIEINSPIEDTECGSREIELAYTVYNINSSAILPSATPIAFYANSTLIGQAETTIDLSINESEGGTLSILIPENIPADFILKASVDDLGDGIGIVNELNENNNEFELEMHLLIIPVISELQDLELCDVLGIELFNLTEATQSIDPIYQLTYHNSEEEAQVNENAIENPEEYLNTENPEIIYIRVDNGDCFITDSFEIEIIVCPLPDATINIDNNLYACRERNLIFEYTVYNVNATASLPADTPIALYLDGILFAQMQTLSSIPINGSESNNIEFTLPSDTPNNFIFKLMVDDDGSGNGIVEELIEINNEFETYVEFGSISPIDELPNLLKCDEGFDTASFNLTSQNELISTENNDNITYYTSLENAIAAIDEIEDLGSYQNTSDPQMIYVRLENEICFTTTSFELKTENCKPDIPEGFSPSGDNINDEFEIKNLLNIYPDFELSIYSRYGNLIYKGYNEEGFWNGISNEGILYNNSLVPIGVYFYVLQLNDPAYSEPFIGDIYVNY